MSSMDLTSLTPAQQQAVLNGPALTPPAGTTSILDNPPNKNDMAHAIYITCFVLGSIFVFMRIYGTWFCAKKAHISDYIMLVTYCFFASFMAIILCQVHVGYFVHQWNFRLKDAIRLFYLFNVATNLWAVTIMLIKAAILLEWLRIFVPRGSRNYFYWITIALLCIDILFYSAAIITVNLTCVPHAKIWDPLLSGHCIDSKSVDITSAAINFVIDVVVLVLPQKVIWGLNLSFDKRLGVSAAFMVGFLACFAAGFRLAVTVSYSLSEDVTYTFCTVGVWVVVETTCGLMVFCTPALPKAFAELGVTKIYTSFKSWTSETLIKKPDTRSGHGTHGGPSYKETFKPRQWQELGGRPDASSTASGSVPGLADSYDLGAGLDDSLYNPALSKTAILRTTQIGITTEEEDHGKAFDVLEDRQDPWRSQH